MQQSPISRLKIRLYHQGKDGYSTALDLDEQSDGTQRIIHLLPLIRMLQMPGATVVIDEIDRRLHPKLAQLFIESLLECPEGEEPPSSQIIFTTHETHLLDVDILRQDEIWFVEKDRGGGITPVLAGGIPHSAGAPGRKRLSKRSFRSGAVCQ